MTFHAKMTMPDSQRYPWNLYLINSVEEFVVFSICFPAVEMRLSLLETTHIEIIRFQNHNQWYLIQTWSDKAFKSTVVNRTLPSLHGESLKIAIKCLTSCWIVQGWANRKFVNCTSTNINSVIHTELGFGE